MSNGESYIKDCHLSWDDLHADTIALARQLGDDNDWKGIIAITRGGMVPACIVASELGVLNVETLCITSYDVKEQSEAKTLKTPENIEDQGQGWIIVDDLADTGQTFKLARESYPKAHYACVYTKPRGESQADSYIKSFPQDTWVHFPWEVN